MNGEQEITLKGGHSPRAIEEASAWLALLHGPSRTRPLEEGFRRWIEADCQHEAAFGAVTAMWDATEGLARKALPLPSRERREARPAGARPVRLRVAMVAAGVALIAVVTAVWVIRPGQITTETGEQRMVTLDDGTRVYLNTDTRVRIAYSNERRGVVLESGEALFDVARRGPQWPFVVTAGARQVTALGTSFIVRQDTDALTITLIDGKVSVSAMGSTNSDARVLDPGQRLTFTVHGRPTLDHPAVDQLTAWRQGRVEFDDTPLAAAAAEMNRYSNTKLRIEQNETGAIAIKGAFRAGDALSFAQSIAATCQLEVLEKPHEIVLAGLPSAHCKE
jgi:transmembrane sensor